MGGGGGGEGRVPPACVRAGMCSHKCTYLTCSDTMSKFIPSRSLPCCVVSCNGVSWCIVVCSAGGVHRYVYNILLPVSVWLLYGTRFSRVKLRLRGILSSGDCIYTLRSLPPLSSSIHQHSMDMIGHPLMPGLNRTSVSATLPPSPM